jgi:cystathionine beta-synthase
MRDNGFLAEGVGGATVRDLLGGRYRKVITTQKHERVEAVVAKMKQHDISQMPVVDNDGNVQGMVHEYDLLNFLIEGRHRLSEPVAELTQPLQGEVSLDTPVAALRDIFNQDNVAVVKEGARVVGIVTKIDLIDFLGAHLR